MSPPFIGSRIEKGQDVDRLLSVLELDNVADIHIGALSGGQMQRALFARAMVSNPELLILDEPDTYMAPDFKAMMPSLIKEINKTCAVVMVSHNFEEISIFIHFVFIDKTARYAFQFYRGKVLGLDGVAVIFG